jgi:DNA-binding beta-propeller fold protein YncE
MVAAGPMTPRSFGRGGMMRKRDFFIGAALVALLVGMGVGQRALEKTAAAQAASGTVMAPKFVVDPMFPKPLPNHWYQGMSIGVSVDSDDHIWIVHRPDSLSPAEAALDNGTGACCAKAPPILEFDQQGNLLEHWGGQDGPGYKWPSSNHGIDVDAKGNVWIGGNGAGDGEVLEFTHDGKFIKKIGDVGVTADSNSTTHFLQVAKVFIDDPNNEVYVADGYGNKRVAVIDENTGAFKRFWGAYGHKPDDTNMGRYSPTGPLDQQFRNPVHCAELSNDNLVYVCDRVNDRIQVFQKDGTFVKEAWVSKNTLGDGSVWDIAFSTDPQQKYIYLADGHDEKVWILDRQSLEILTSFGDGGRQPGQFYAVHSIAVDSKGNIYTTETYDGRRLQRFLYKGIQSVPRGDQGTVWPTQ